MTLFQYKNEEQPFENASEAWFWYCNSQNARYNCSNLANDHYTTIVRPCDPDDIYLCVARLIAEGEISQDQVMVLVKYGEYQFSPPANDNGDLTSESKLWDSAMKTIEKTLRAKKIIL